MGKGGATRKHFSPEPDFGQEDMVRDAMLAGVMDRSRREMADVLDRTPTVEALCTLMEDQYALLDSMQAELAFSPPLACERGCSYCCYNQISLTPAEALYLGFHILETHGPEDLAALKSRVDHIMGLISGKDVWAIGAIRHLTPCPLLVDGACSTHPARPLACRGWNAVDRNQCRLSVEERDPMMLIENYAVLRDLAENMQVGMLQGSEDCRYEAGYLVITRALAKMLDRGVVACAGEWLAGEPFFGRVPENRASGRRNPGS